MSIFHIRGKVSLYMTHLSEKQASKQAKKKSHQKHGTAINWEAKGGGGGSGGGGVLTTCVPACMWLCDAKLSLL